MTLPLPRATAVAVAMTVIALASLVSLASPPPATAGDLPGRPSDREAARAAAAARFGGDGPESARRAEADSKESPEKDEGEGEEKKKDANAKAGPGTLLRVGTLHVGDGRVLSPAAIHLRGGAIATVAAEIVAPEGAVVRELPGAVATPGLFEPEALVPAEGSRGAAAAVLSAADARDPWDPWLAPMREGGLIGACLVPPAGSTVGGRAVAIGTTGPGASGAPILVDDAALSVSFATETAGSAVRAKARAAFSGLLESAEGYREQWKEWEKHEKEAESGSKKKKKKEKSAGRPPREPKKQPEQEVLLKVVDGDLALRAEAHRPEDVRAALRIAQARTTAVTIAGCTECVAVASELEGSRAVVLLRPLIMAARETGFGEMDADLFEVLDGAGVRLAVSAGRSWPASAEWLRVAAADLVGRGVAPESAVAAMTGEAAAACGLPAEKRLVEKGATTTIALWSADPLDPSARLLELVVPADVTNDSADAGSDDGDDDASEGAESPPVASAGASAEKAGEDQA